tara:strand:- start:15884 stop:16081 length:198 start_codon:yes stop_codon:yes gene_type:complete
VVPLELFPLHEVDSTHRIPDLVKVIGTQGEQSDTNEAAANHAQDILTAHLPKSETTAPHWALIGQ